MKITNNTDSVIYDFGPKKYNGAKGFTNVKLVGEVFYVISVEINNKFSIKFTFYDVSLPKLDSALSLYKQLIDWQTGSGGSGGVIGTTITTDDDYIYWYTPDGRRKKSAGTLAPET